MAGPSIAVRILGDLTGFSKSVNDTATKGEGAATRLHGAFSGVLGTLNASGVLGPFGAALDGIDGAISKIADHGKGIGTTLMGVGGALAGVGAGLSAVGSKDQAAHQQLQQAVQATGKDYEDYAGQVEKAIGKQEKYGTSADHTQDALRIMTQAMGDPAKALQYLGEASDLAAAKHESLDTAATQLSKAYGGSAKVLKEFGINLKTMTDAHGNAITGAEANARAMDLLGQKISGQADASASTFSGHLSALKAKFEDIAANLGAKYGPAITAVGTAMVGVGAVFQAAPAIMGILSAAWDALTVAEYASMLPYLLIIAGLAAIGVAVYELVTHWSDVWGAIQAAVAAVWQWIVDHWPLLLAVLLGPIGIAVGQIIKHWDTIHDAVVAVYQWIVDHWPLLLAVITGPIGIAVAIVVGHWGTIRNAAQGVWDWLSSTWSAVTGFITAPITAAVGVVQGAWDSIKGGATEVYNWIKGKFDAIAGAISGVIGGVSDAVGGVVNAIKAPIDAVIRAWNRLEFTVPSITLPSFDTHIPGVGTIGGGTIGGFTVGFPDIPQLAQGGLITQTGLIYAHAGEAISPMPANLPGGAPVVNIEYADFHSEVDVDLLMRRAAWAVQTRAA